MISLSKIKKVDLETVNLKSFDFDQIDFESFDWGSIKVPPVIKKIWSKGLDGYVNSTDESYERNTISGILLKNSNKIELTAGENFLIHLYKHFVKKKVDNGEDLRPAEKEVYNVLLKDELKKEKELEEAASVETVETTNEEKQQKPKDEKVETPKQKEEREKEKVIETPKKEQPKKIAKPKTTNRTTTKAKKAEENKETVESEEASTPSSDTVLNSNPFKNLHAKYSSNKNLRVEDTHDRHTFLVRKDLLARLEAHAKDKKRGFMKDFINEAIEISLDALDELEKSNAK